MFRNQYDSDISTFSPQGRLFQIEYALEAVKQGSACVGIKSKTHVVLVALQRQGGELASYQKKVVKLDNHMGIAFAGLTSDARVLSNYMRNECMRHKMVFARPLPALRAVTSVADKAQINTQRYGSRPYGVGFLIASADDAGVHLHEFSPTGNAPDYLAHSIGSRSQSARTYLEKHVDAFASASLDELVQHGLHALRDTLPSDKELTVENVAVAVVGVDTPFAQLGRDQVDAQLQRFNATIGQGAAAAAAGAAPSGGAGAGDDDAMDTTE
ncbi:20S proteasome subunit alpha 6 [Catenaria anguillulae PL171]|uniref:Proteasome subunit alpha type n=1 Tax=Catenaria anguillulae PL171 TaxID=765915 RepID=A0A1Y2HRE4_9FUNG|nr:20S proteasome subunit alpha 6 [Catenaria anguillulae PL171]